MGVAIKREGVVFLCLAVSKEMGKTSHLLVNTDASLQTTDLLVSLWAWLCSNAPPISQVYHSVTAPNTTII